MNNQQIAEFEAQMQADKEYARKNGIKRMCPGWYYVASATGEVFEIQRGDFCEYEGANAQMWFVKVMNGEVVGDYMTLADAKAAVKAMGADDAPSTADDDDDDDFVPMFSYMRGELGEMEAQAEAPAPAPAPAPADDDDDYNEENHGDLTIELPQEYAVFNLHGKYEELANAMHDRLEKQFRLTTDLFGDSDEPVTIADIDDILDEDAYDGWRVFVDGWWDNELRLYAQRDGADIEDATPSRYSDWHMIDADHGYLTIGTPV